MSENNPTLKRLRHGAVIVWQEPGHPALFIRPEDSPALIDGQQEGLYRMATDGALDRAGNTHPMLNGKKQVFVVYGDTKTGGLEVRATVFTCSAEAFRALLERGSHAELALQPAHFIGHAGPGEAV